MRIGRLACALCLLVSAVVRAQPNARNPQPEDVLPLSELDDPIGVDEDSRTLDEVAPRPGTGGAKPSGAAADAAAFGPEPPRLKVREGEVLTAPGSTREQTHRVQVQLAPGLARVRVEMHFESRSAIAGELRYRLAVPRNSRLVELEVCNANGCRTAALADDEDRSERAYVAALLARPVSAEPPLPIAHAREGRDARGALIALRAAPVREGLPLRVRLSYVAHPALHGGTLRLQLPARGMDPQAAQAELSVHAPELIDVRAGGASVESSAGFDPWVEVELRARLPSTASVQAQAYEFPCGARGRRCGRAQVWAGPRPGAPVDLVIALDVSPSTEGEARGRLVPAIAALLSVLPPGSRVRALAFAARAQALIAAPMEPGRVDLAPFARAIAQEQLGSATRFEAVWELASAWLSRPERGAPRPLVVIVGDGGLTLGGPHGNDKPHRSSQAGGFDKARAMGVEVSAINAADRDTPAALRAAVQRTSGIVIQAGAEAKDAARGRDPSPLHDKLLALFAPVVARSVAVVHGGARVELGALRAGEQRVFAAPVRGELRLTYGGRAVRSRPPAPALRAALSAAVTGMPGRAFAALDARDLPLSDHGWPAQPAKGSCDRRGPARRHGGLSRDGSAVVPVAQPACEAAERAAPVHANAAREQPQPGRGMPADPLLSMLRQRILPVARGCFRRDRAGRAEYEKRAVFAFTLAEREVVAAGIEGAIPAALRKCLLAAVDTLDVPRFTGIVKVRYPLVTESVPLPEQIELETGTAVSLDQLFGTGGAEPHR